MRKYDHFYRHIRYEKLDVGLILAFSFDLLQIIKSNLNMKFSLLQLRKLHISFKLATLNTVTFISAKEKLPIVLKIAVWKKKCSCGESLDEYCVGESFREPV